MVNNRSIVIAFRVTPSEAAHLDAAAKALRQPRQRADYCRAAALHLAKARVPAPVAPVRRPARRMPAADFRLLGQILGQVGKLGANLNQLARIANSNGILPPDLSGLTAEVVAIRATLAAALRGDDVEQGQ